MSSEEVKDVFGCDIGNGFGFISVLKEVKADPIPMFPTKYNLGLVGMPTSAYITPPDGEKIEVFDTRPAYDKHKRESEKFIHAVKTRLREGTVSMPGIEKPVSLDAVYAAVARDLIKLGNEQRKNRGEEPVYEIVFTFPASFTVNINLLNRMQKSIESVQVDGHNIKVAGRLPEPAAVAIDYLYYMQNIVSENLRLKGDSFTALVYDLGHGTFDAAVVTARSKGEPYKLHINDGLPDVGGKDFDDVLYNEICRVLKQDYGYTPKNASVRESIRLAAVEMKHELSDAEVSRHDFTLSDGDIASVEITRTTFEEKSRTLVNRTFELVDRVLQQAKKDNIHINAVVMSGGGSRMPMVTSGLKQLLQEDNIPIQIYRPSEAVSYGAARYAQGIASSPTAGKSNPEPVPSDLLDAVKRALDNSPQTVPAASPVLEKYTEYSYGIWVPSETNLSGEVMVLVPGKKKLPAASESIALNSSDSPMRLRLYRSKEKNPAGATLDVEEQCESIMFIPFEVPANTECNVRIEVMDDYNIKVECKAVNGPVIVKSTFDDFLKV